MNALLYVVIVAGHLLPHTSFVITSAFIFTQQPAVVVLPRQRTIIPLYARDIGSSNTIIYSSSNSEIEETPSSSLQQQKMTKKPPRPSPTGFSYVEEGVYTNIEEEIEAMGGDPSFLTEAPPANDKFVPTANDATLLAVESDASPVVWEWDGVEKDDAYFDE